MRAFSHCVVSSREVQSCIETKQAKQSNILSKCGPINHAKFCPLRNLQPAQQSRVLERHHKKHTLAEATLKSDHQVEKDLDWYLLQQELSSTPPHESESRRSFTHQLGAVCAGGLCQKRVDIVFVLIVCIKPTLDLIEATQHPLSDICSQRTSRDVDAACTCSVS